MRRAISHMGHLFDADKVSAVEAIDGGIRVHLQGTCIDLIGGRYYQFTALLDWDPYWESDDAGDIVRVHRCVADLTADHAYTDPLPSPCRHCTP